MFASRLNNQVKAYCSWKPDIYSVFVDAFTVDWKQFKLIYMFPPFSLLGSCIQKIRLEEANAVVVAPLSPTQPWYTPLMEMLVDQPILIRRNKDMIFMPHKAATHSLQKTLKLMICRVSGKDIENKAFLEKQLVYSISMASWRSSTKKQYQSFIKRWIQYCNKRKIKFSSTRFR